MSRFVPTRRWTAGLAAAGLFLGGLAYSTAAGQKKVEPAPRSSEEGRPVKDRDNPHPDLRQKELETALDWQVPNGRWKQPFKDEQPIYFVSWNKSPEEWNQLRAFWNEVTEEAVDPVTGQPVKRKAVKIKVPLGLTTGPTVPVENPMTVARWALGKRLYFDEVLSSDLTVSCASCHDPKKGFTDQAPFSVGIRQARGGISAPTVFNAAYNPFQFWDGRALSLEDQAQGPVQNPIEMFGGDGEAWHAAVKRVREKGDYSERFKEAFGTEPTRDAIAKALAAYERTVLSGNSVHDRADLAMRVRVEEEGVADFTVKAADYETVLKEAFAKNDTHALEALGLDPAKDAGKAGAVAKQVASGRELFFGKARCNSCHVGDNFTDNTFHNLGVGVRDGKLPATQMGRYAHQPVGHKNAEFMGAFKTPTLRGLLGTGPYLHDGSEKTLEKVVEFYDRGGNANEFLDPKMRDVDAERAYLLSKQNGTEYEGPKPEVFTRDGRPIIPLKLNLTEQEKKDLVLFLRALEGDPIDPIVADKGRMPRSVSARR